MKTNLFKFITNNEIKIPTYQRIYTWKKEQIESFIEDLLFDINKERAINLGVVYVDQKADNNYELIDGQQRVTTFYLLVNALAFLRDDLKQKQIKKIIQFNKEKKLRTTIASLNQSYDDFYEFINHENLSESPKKIKNLLREYISSKNLSNNEEDNDGGKIKSELITGLKVIVDFLTLEVNKNYMELLSKKDSKGNYEIFDVEFFQIENPYPNDPISLFERLNNRGVELNFVSLSKIKVHQYIINNHSSADVSNDDLENKANEFLISFNETIYEPFERHPKSMTADNKDIAIQKALISYLEIYTGEKIGNDKNKALEQLGKFLDKNFGSIKNITKFNKAQIGRMVKNVFEHFQIFLSVQLLFENNYKKFKGAKGEIHKASWIINQSTLRSYVLLNDINKDALYSAEEFSKLKVMKLEKYISLMIYVVSLHIQSTVNDEDQYFESDEKLTEFSNKLVTLSINYWLKFIGSDFDYSKLLRDDLELEEFTNVINKSIETKKSNSKILKAIEDKANALIKKYDNDKSFNKLKETHLKDLEKHITKNQNSNAEKDWSKTIIQKARNSKEFLIK